MKKNQWFYVIFEDGNSALINVPEIECVSFVFSPIKEQYMTIAYVLFKSGIEKTISLTEEGEKDFKRLLTK